MVGILCLTYIFFQYFPFLGYFNPVCLDLSLFSKHTVKSHSCDLISVSLVIMPSPLSFNVLVLHIIHTQFLIQKMLQIYQQTRSISDSCPAFCCYQLCIHSISNSSILHPSVSSYELCFSSMMKTEAYMLYLYYCICLFFSNVPVQNKRLINSYQIKFKDYLLILLCTQFLYILEFYIWH